MNNFRAFYKSKWPKLKSAVAECIIFGTFPKSWFSISNFSTNNYIYHYWSLGVISFYRPLSYPLISWVWHLIKTRFTTSIRSEAIIFKIKICVCLPVRISLTVEPIWFSCTISVLVMGRFITILLSVPLQSSRFVAPSNRWKCARAVPTDWRIK